MVYEFREYPIWRERETETEPNRFCANVNLPTATVSKFDPELLFQGEKGGLLVNLLYISPRIGRKINGRIYVSLQMLTP